MKIADILKESRFERRVPPQIKALIPQLLQAAQRVYDDWDEDEDEYAGGGICHLIADAMCEVFMKAGIPCNTVSGQQGEVHVWSVVLIEEGEQPVVYSVDIPPYVYETGGGYSWQKIQGVTFTAEHLDIMPVCRGHDCIAEYEFELD